MTSAQGKHRVGGFATTATNPHGDQGRNGGRTLGAGLGNGASNWNSGSGSIWGSNIYGGTSKNGKHDMDHNQSEPFSSNRDMTTGSSSLLSSSELDSTGRGNTTWMSREDAAEYSLLNATRPGSSPNRRQSSAIYTPTDMSDTDPTDAIFPFNQPTSSLATRTSQKISLDPTSRDFIVSHATRSGQYQNSRNNSEEDSVYDPRRTILSRVDSGLSPTDRAQRSQGQPEYNSRGGSRNGSLPPSRGDVDPSPHGQGDAQNSYSNRYGANLSAQRLNGSSNTPAFTMQSGSSTQMLRPQQSSSRLEILSTQLDDLSFENHKRPSYPSSQHSPNSITGNFPNLRAPSGAGASLNQWSHKDYLHTADQLSPTSSASGFPPPTSFRPGLDGQFSQSPGDSDSRISHQSPYHSSAATPPILHPNAIPRGSHSNHSGQNMPQPSMINARLRGLQQQQQQQQQQQSYQVQQNPLPFRNPVNLPFDVGSQQSFPLNPLAPYYPMQPAPHVLASTQVLRGPARDQDPAGRLRSPLLEDFRNNSKTNKRFDLKDIYDHIVEFSGDQHGSRFIQQKLETANSDEKDQVFRELLPDAFQLMTDVFGNYVIQKFFEHGNQPQKKTLANQMRNRVFPLSTQMYGCRVVQKALEHVLTDQQAQLIKELEHDVMACVRDQNGNHVIQKAIERIPPEHIQFIINAFHGQVRDNAIHPYGCRVIQRMLEHCDEPTRLGVLQELHASAGSLISDQYGNYVTQHVIQHGRPEDRGKIIGLVISNLITFSKHKFASNVVEKSIEFGTLEERMQIVQKLTGLTERGESILHVLIRDQYGNYVVQSLLRTLQGQEWADFAEPVKHQLALLKRFAHGKQVAQVEKHLYRSQYPLLVQSNTVLPSPIAATVPTPPLTVDNSHSPQSSSHPSTHTSSIDAPYTSRKSSGDVVGIFSGGAM